MRVRDPAEKLTGWNARVRWSPLALLRPRRGYFLRGAMLSGIIHGALDYAVRYGHPNIVPILRGVTR